MISISEWINYRIFLAALWLAKKASASSTAYEYLIDARREEREWYYWGLKDPEDFNI